MSHRSFIAANFHQAVTRRSPPLERRGCVEGVYGRHILFLMHLYLKNLWFCIHTLHPSTHRGREGGRASSRRTRERRRMIEVDLASRLTRFDCNTDADCEALAVTIASIRPFPKQETQSVPDHSRKLELVPTDQLQFIVNLTTKRRFSTWIFIQKRLHWIT